MIQSVVQIGSYIKSLEDDKMNNAMSKALDAKFEKFGLQMDKRFDDASFAIEKRFEAIEKRFDAVDKSLSTHSDKMNELICELREAGVVKTTTILK
jgi:hypothetical protein